MSADRDDFVAASGDRHRHRARRRVVLVSGGSGDIGQAICRRLHRDGWTVVIGCVSEDRARRFAADLAGGDHDREPLVARLDLSDLGSVESAVHDVLARTGRLDAIVFSAGTSVHARLRDGIDPSAELAVNFLGPALVVCRSLGALRDAGGGTLVAVTSEAAKVGDAGHAAYGASKAALHGFLVEVARTRHADGIRAASVSPGPIDTQMLHADFGTGPQAEATLAKLTARIPVGRLGRPDEVAAAVGLLVDTPSLSGAHLSVGGGVVMHTPFDRSPT